MAEEQIIIIAILAATVAMFLWGRWRHDMVAAGALLACVVTGLVPGPEAFAGFGHPAVITVACVLILSRVLLETGAVDALVRRIMPAAAGPLRSIASLTVIAAILSAFMNNVGALAILMPVALRLAAREEIPPGQMLMPLAFGSILGGMTTMIGTPPNLIVSGFRVDSGAESFAMFDFAPVGVAVAAAGLIFIVLLGWRLVPIRERAGAEGFETGAYLTEARVPEKSKAVGMTLHQLEEALDDSDAQVVGLVRNDVRIPTPNPRRVVRGGDILVIEAEAEVLANALSALELELEEAKRDQPREKEEKEEKEEEEKEEKKEADGEKSAAGDIVLTELAVLPHSTITGRSAREIRLRTRYGINLLAVSRQGRRSTARLRTMAIRAGDVLLVQGAPETIAEFAADAGCVPLAERPLRVPDRRRTITATAIMVMAVGGAAFGLVPAAIAFAFGVLTAMALRIIPLRSVYEAIDWPVVVLLAALIPVAGAMQTTGTADLIARLLIDGVAQGHAVIGLILILIVTMTLSDLMNNAATAAVMCPIAIGTAEQLGTSADPFLMAVAVGASCAFLTPIGHQNNTLILGPGGFRFGDYWRMGLPLELLVIAVGVPMILLVWPL